MLYTKAANEPQYKLLRWMLSNVKACGADTNLCSISQRSLHQIIYQTGSLRLEDISLNADIACNCKNRSVHTKNESWLAITVSFWETLIKKLGGNENRHFFLELGDSCEICDAKMRATRKRQEEESDDYEQIQKSLSVQTLSQIRRGILGPSTAKISSAWLRRWDDFVTVKSDDPPGKILKLQKSTSISIISREHYDYLAEIY